MSKKTLPILLGAILLIITNILMLNAFRNDYSLKIITEKNTYAEKFAEKNKIQTEILSDSNKDKYLTKIEEFKYIENSSSVIITAYLGESKEIVIPEYISSKKVTTVAKDTFKNTKVTKVYITKNIVSYEDTTNLEIICYNSPYCKTLKEDQKLNVTEKETLDNIDFTYHENEYEYNIISNNVELTKYKGTNKDIIIPTSINGLKVTKVSFILEKYNSVYIPSTVSEIINNSLYNESLIFAVILNVISFLIFTFVILVILKKDKVYDQLPTYIISFIYLLLSYFISYKYNASKDTLKVLSIIISLIYITLAYLLRKAHINTIKTNEKLSSKTFVDKALEIVNDLSLSEEETKKLIEVIKYSDPISTSETKELEEEILTKLKDLKTKDDISEVEKQIKKRNNLCKKGK